MKRRAILVAISAFAIGLGTTAYANDAGLYQDVVDPSSSFVRVLAPTASAVLVAGELVDLAEGGLSPYRPLTAGPIVIEADDNQTNLDASPGTFYTVAFSAAGETKVFVDEVVNSPAKANLTVYNLDSDASVDLYVPAAKAKAIEGLEAGSTQTVALKAPLTLDFIVQQNGADVAELSQLELKRGGGISIFISKQGAAVSATASITTLKR